MRRVRKFLALSASEESLLVVAAVLYAVFSVTLRVRSLDASEALARRLARWGLSRWPPEQVNWALSVVESTLPGSGGCLPAALVGLAVSDGLLELRIGVRDTAMSIEAHAWLECGDGRLIYAGANPAEFRRLDGE